MALVPLFSGIGYAYRFKLRSLLKSYYKYEMAHAIKAHVAGLPEIDEARLIAIESPTKGAGVGSYSVGSEKYTIVADKSFVGEQAQHLAGRWRQLKFQTYANSCFHPHHAIQFRKNGKVIMESVVCFTCRGVLLPALAFNNVRVYLEMDDTNIAAFQKMQEEIDAMIGTPAEAELKTTH